MKKIKMRKSKIAQVVVLIGSIIVGLIFFILNLFLLGNSNFLDVIVSLLPSLLMSGCLYIFLYLIIVIEYRKKEKDESNFERLKEYLQGTEKEVRYLYHDNDMESYILKSIVNSYNLHYFVKIANDDTIDLSVKNDDGKEICTINISDLRYFRKFFEFEKENNN